MNEFDLRVPAYQPKVAIVAGRFNQFVTQELIAGAKDALHRCGLRGHSVNLYWVPGAFELALAADQILSNEKADAVLAFGAVIRGETSHFDYVAGECASGLSKVALKYGKPVIFGVLTTDTIEQAMERAAQSQGNRGFDCAMAALHMLGLLEHLESE
ncbi:MAG: 6,7-dimethyl-8-ribityllumazine synthase [Lysobacterales bacterium]|jgi:6,7-dimethyl-8-ribityllumazine synthase